MREYISRALAAQLERQDRVRGIARAIAIIEGWGALLPARLCSEDLGDYIEDISRRIAGGQRFLVWVRVAAAIFYTGVNAIGYVLKALGKRTAAQ